MVEPEPLAQGAQSGSETRRHRRNSFEEEPEVSRSRLSIGACVGAGIILCVTAFSGGAAARTTGATHANGVIKLGMITKFPVGFYFTLQNGAKKFDKATPGAKVVFAQGKSATDDAGEIAAIQDMVASGVKGIAIAPTSPGSRAGAEEGDQGRGEDRSDRQRHPDVERQVVRRRDEQLQRRRSGRQVHRCEAEAGRQARHPRRGSRRAVARRPRQRDAQGARAR